VWVCVCVCSHTYVDASAIAVVCVDMLVHANLQLLLLGHVAYYTSVQQLLNACVFYMFAKHVIHGGTRHHLIIATREAHHA